MRLRIRILLCRVLWPALLLSLTFMPGAMAAARPNIVFILADQWRAEAFGYAGNPDVKTPQIDRLERDGIRFLNAVSGMPVCCPARASLLTGQRPLTHGVFMNDVPLASNAVTVAKVLRDSGYDTAYIGKWHLDGRGRSSFIPRERRQGFEYWKVMECTHDYTNSFFYADSPAKLKWEGYDAQAQTQDAQQYLRDTARTKKPFFLFLSWGPPHDPYQTAPEKYRSLYAPEKLKLRGNIPKDTESKARKDLAGYYSHCTALDDCLGAIRETLRDTGLETNTIFIFSSDHGDLLGAHGGSNKQQPYDESILVPLILRWPSGLGSQPRRLDAPICMEDFMPTLLGLCRLAIPKTVEGLDHSGYLRGGQSPSDGATLIACVTPFGQWARKLGGREYRGIRTQRHTWVRDIDGPWLLFDNREDPLQRVNLAGRPEYASLQDELDLLLKRKLTEAHDDFLPGERYIRKWGYPVDATGTVPYAP